MESIQLALTRKPGSRSKERCIEAVFFLCALVSVATTAGIILALAREALLFFRDVPVGDFLFGTVWTPLFEPASYGVVPLVFGSFQIVVGSGLIAVPVGLASAIYLSEYASRRARAILKPALEVLAGIPTVVYGYFALMCVTPVIQALFPQTQVFNAASASIVVGVMILPMVASLCDDALRAVPVALRRGAFALGATRFEVATRVVLPAALSGVVASFVLAFSRAIGETMAVTLAAGNMPKVTLNPLESIQTMTAYIVQVCSGDHEQGTTPYYSVFAVGALLFLITLGANLIANRVLRRFREVYE